MSRKFYSITLILSIILGIVLFFAKSEISGNVLLTTLFVISMITVTSVHGIIVHSIDIKKQMHTIKFPLLMGAIFAVIFFIWVFFIMPAFCPDFINNFNETLGY